MKKMLLSLAVLVTCVIPAVCAAAPVRPGPYFSGFLGASILRDADVSSFDFIENRAFEDRVEFDPGIFFGGTGGYDFGLLRLEGEISYKYAEIDSITDKVDGFKFRSPDGSVGALAVMFNTFFDFHNTSPVTPYIGGGIGFAALHIDDTFGTDTRGGFSERLFLYAEDDDTVFAYQAGAGIEIALSRTLSLDFGYRYFGTSTANFDSDFAIETEMKFESHNAMAGMRVKF